MHNNAFIAANQALVARARELEIDTHVPFLCECGGPSCTAIIPMTVNAYTSLRSDRSTLVTSPGH